MEWDATIHIDTTDPLTIDVLEAVAAVGGAAGGNPGEHRLDTTITVEADTVADAAAQATERFAYLGDFIAVEVMTVAEADHRLASLAFPELAGIAEIAAILQISRQRASELQTHRDFPAPVARLASGPVWRRSDLTTFEEHWQRRPGRPQRAQPTSTTGSRAHAGASETNIGTSSRRRSRNDLDVRR